jgi:erythromycin esterase-like protein
VLFAAWLAPTVVIADPEIPQEAHLVAAIRANAQALSQAAGDYDRLLDSIGQAKVVMLGEATHGSAEFYDQRASLTRRLVAEKGFGAVIFEMGWAPALRLDAFVSGRLGQTSSSEALKVFTRFPRWVWRNEQFAAFLDALKALNDNRGGGDPLVSIYGMDLYELPEAVAEVLEYLRARDPRAALQARRDYRCFAPYSRIALDPQLYGRDVARGWMPSCARQVRARLAQLSGGGDQGRDPAAFAALMSARSIAGAEAYYRTLYAAGAQPSWNLRERFLADTIRTLVERHGKVVVWAHNTHQGDARATDQAKVGELSIGQLMREHYGDDAVYLVGMTTYGGSVRAASGWSSLLHQAGLPAFLLIFRDNPALASELERSALDRAVGVTYLPLNELENHYWNSSPAKRFDALIHIDATRAVTPLH